MSRISASRLANIDIYVGANKSYPDQDEVEMRLKKLEKRINK